MSAQAFLALAVTAGVAGLALAWWIAAQLDAAPGRAGLAPVPGRAPGGARQRGLGGGVDVARAYAEALVWARQQPTAVLVEITRRDPDGEAVFVWAAAHRALGDRGVTPLPLLERQAAPR